MRAILALAAGLASAGASTALAEEIACPIERAVYADVDASLTLAFREIEDESFTATNVFTVTFANEVSADGLVIWNQGYSVPNGIIQDCPSGDVTGDELAACVIWEGVIYAVDGLGNVAFIPPEGVDAPDQLLFPDLGRTIRYSALWSEEKVTIAPWDVLTLAGCTP